MSSFLPFEEKIRRFIDKQIGNVNLNRVKDITNSWYQHKGPLGAINRITRAFQEIGKEDSWRSSDKKVKDNFNEHKLFHLNSMAKFLNSQNRMVLHHIKICVQQLAEGQLVHQFTDKDWRDNTTFYFYYKYEFGNDIQIYLVKTESERNGTSWENHIFSNHDSIDYIKKEFQRWFWREVNNTVFFTFKQIGLGKEVVPILQNSHDELHPFIGNFGPKEVYEYWKKFISVGIPRSLLFLGPPGTGKTTTVRSLAKQNNLKLARLDPHILATLMDEEGFSVWNTLFNPDIILIDDVHGIDKDSGLSAMLSILEHINKSIDKNTLVVGTANKLKNVDIALRRPGRFDAAYHFSSHGYEEKILDLYADIYGCTELIKEKKKWLVKQFSSLTPAYIKEVVKNVKALNGEEGMWEFIEDRIELMVQLNMDSEEKDAEITSSKKKKETVGFADLPRPKSKAGF